MRFSSFSKFIGFSFVFLFLLSCSKQNSEGKEIFQMSEVFTFAPVKEKDNQLLVAIAKDKLGKEFLLHTHVIPQGRVAMGQSKKTRIVTFQRTGDTLYLNESPEENAISKDFSQEFILGSAPIQKETPHSLSFDFNRLMPQVYTNSEWRGRDLSGEQVRQEREEVAISHARIAQIELLENFLTIRQVGVEKTNIFGITSSSAVEIKYYLTPYESNSKFQKGKPADFRNFGFFEISPRPHATKTSEILPSRFSLEKPITYYLSSNTPSEYREAVKDGALYWNLALGKEIVQIKEAPNGVTAPDPRYNIIQWVNDDLATYAYADASADPRTGQILHAQVYITSVFAISSKKAARRVIGETLKKTPPVVSKVPSNMCNFHAHEAFEGLADAVAVAENDAQLLKASQDFVRALVAHEIGHTLGLRHNFAGSFESFNFPPAKRKEMFSEYLKTDQLLESVIPSSTVMDYLGLPEMALIGQRIRSRKPILGYDGKAMAVLYEGKEFSGQQAPFFCTDSHMGKVADCKTFDFGSSVVEYANFELKNRMENLPLDILETYRAHKLNETTNLAKPLDQVAIEPESVISILMSPRANFLEASDPSQRLLPVLRFYPNLTSANLEQVKEKELGYLSAELKKVGGLSSVLPFVTKDTIQNSYLDFSKRLAQDKDFTPADRETIRRNVEIFYRRLPEAFGNSDLTALSKIPDSWKILGTELGDSLMNLILNRAEAYLFSLESEPLEVGLEVPSSILVRKNEKDKPETLEVFQTLSGKLPKHRFSLALRLKVAGLLKAGSLAEDWGVKQAAILKKQYKSYILKCLGYSADADVDLDKLKPTEVQFVFAKSMKAEDVKINQREAFRWLSEAKKIYSSF